MNNKEPEDTLDTLVKETLSKVGKAKNTGKIVAIAVATISALICVTVLWFKLRRQGKELAKLRHEKNLASEKVHQDIVNERLAENEEEKDAYVAQANQHMDIVDDLNDKIAIIREEHQRTKDLITTLVTWEDVDKYLNEEK